MASKIKILYLSPSIRLLGARRSLSQLTASLDPEFQSVVVCPHPGALSYELTRHSVPVRFVSLYNWRKGKFFFHRYVSVLRLRNLIKAERPNIIHCNEFYTVPYALKASKGTIPVVTHMRLSITPRMIKNYLLEKVDRVITVSKAAAEFFNQWPYKTKVRTIYNGVDLQEFAPLNRSECRQKLGLPVNQVVFGHIATIDPRKAQDIVIEAAAIVLKACPECCFIFAGNARPSHQSYFQELQRKISSFGLEGKIRFLPFQDDVTNLYGVIDVNLLPSRQEGFGRTIIEAGAMGIPSIGSQVGGIPELIEPGKTGFLIRPDSPEELAEKLANLYHNQELRNTLGQNARQLVAREFSIEKHKNEIQKLYVELLQERRLL